MSKTLLSVLVVGVVVVGGYFVFMGGESETDNGEKVAGEITEQEDQKMAFSDFINQGGSYKCEVSQKINNTETTGTTYISDGMVSGAYSTTVQGVAMTSNMVVRDGYTYSWNSMLPNMGFKVKAQTEINPSSSTANLGSYEWNANQISDYNCQPWTVDSTVFEIPSGIEFRDMEAK